MSFAAPLVLLGLIALPLLVLLYVRFQRERGRAQAAFAAPHLTPSVAPHRPGWRRHAPMLALALAAAVLVVAAARPQRTVAVPVEQASIMLLTDVSGSMAATDVAPSRLVAAQRAAQAFTHDVPGPVKIGVMAFNTTASVLQSPTTDRKAVNAALAQLTAGGTTATGNAITVAVSILGRKPPAGTKRPPAAIVLLSDGASVKGVNPLTAAAAAHRLHIPIYTVALGTAQGTITVGGRNGKPLQTVAVPPDPASLAQIARASGGRAATATDEGVLRQVYEKLGSKLGHKKVKRELTSGFAGGGLALLALGALMSLRWFGRLI